MAAPKGNNNNPNGRPVGSLNKANADLRQWVSNFIQSQQNQILKDWEALEPKDRIVMFDKLMRYVLPTLQATTLQTDFERLTDDQLDHIINELRQQHEKRQD